ncbi:MAG TPA: hypothetical protein VGQ62_15390, partial [Chloroflexota bacterium]|nr:hypothetical protein [Chloroflexota bacterium]
ALAQVALADWYVRRAAASGDVGQCQRGRAALGGPPQAEPSAATLLAELGPATVSRDASAGNPARVAPPPSDALTLLDLYASGYLDVVTATAPLPQYLAAVYGGSLSAGPTSVPNGQGRSAEQLVDDLAQVYPQWEPDALYEALRSR